MATGIVIVKQYEKMVVFSLGKYTGSLKGAGFHFSYLLFHSGRVVDTREVPERVPTQQYITKDNVVVDMDFCTLLPRPTGSSGEIDPRGGEPPPGGAEPGRGRAQVHHWQYNSGRGAKRTGADTKSAPDYAGRKYGPLGGQGPRGRNQRDRPTRMG